MGLDRKSIPDRLLRLVSPADRAKLGLNKPFSEIVNIALKHENTGHLGAVSNPKRKQSALPALVNSTPRSRKSKRSVVARVAIVSFRHKAIDGDNLQTGAKFLRDAIAKQLGLDDAEGAGIEWSYAQVVTRGEQGVLVRVEMSTKTTRIQSQDGL